jgi:uncharacterized protein (UPF0261 family)
MEPKTKGEKITGMTEAVAILVKKLYNKGEIHGVLAAGGLQNTVMATNAMRQLPIGFPKVMATTVSSGKKTFDMVVGDKDIVVIPSICDFTGLNLLTEQILKNAAACCVGMVKEAGQVLEKGRKPVVGLTLMGVTNTGCCAAVDELERLGIEVIGFHATGVGGSVMEQMAADGLIDGILDMTTHEITSDYFGSGFSFGENAKYRLVKSVDLKIPLVVCPGGLDFVDYAVNEFPPRMDERKYIMHNTTMAHIKILPDEAVGVAKLLTDKLERAESPIKVLLPSDGMRHNTRVGEELYDEEVDGIIKEAIKAVKNENVEVISIEGNLDTKEWGIQAAHHMIDALKQFHIIGDEERYRYDR